MVYTVPYMCCGLLMGSLTPMVNRKMILGLSMLLGGVSQFVSGTFNSFPLLCGMRVLHGSVNAATNPLSYSLIADYVPPNRRATANAIISSSIYTGVSMSSLSILLIKTKGWRWIYRISGAVGIALGILFMLLVKEPKRGRYENTE